jgi:hypothetical protein
MAPPHGPRRHLFCFDRNRAYALILAEPKY